MKRYLFLAPLVVLLLNYCGKKPFDPSTDLGDRIVSDFDPNFTEFDSNFVVAVDTLAVDNEFSYIPQDSINQNVHFNDGRITIGNFYWDATGEIGETGIGYVEFTFDTSSLNNFQELYQNSTVANHGLDSIYLQLPVDEDFTERNYGTLPDSLQIYALPRYKDHFVALNTTLLDSPHTAQVNPVGVGTLDNTIRSVPFGDSLVARFSEKIDSLITFKNSAQSRDSELREASALIDSLTALIDDAAGVDTTGIGEKLAEQQLLYDTLAQDKQDYQFQHLSIALTTTDSIISFSNNDNGRPSLKFVFDSLDENIENDVSSISATYADYTVYEFNNTSTPLDSQTVSSWGSARRAVFTINTSDYTELLDSLDSIPILKAIVSLNLESTYLLLKDTTRQGDAIISSYYELPFDYTLSPDKNEDGSTRYGWFNMPEATGSGVELPVEFYLDSLSDIGIPAQIYLQIRSRSPQAGWGSMKWKLPILQRMRLETLFYRIKEH
ncbi:MAG: hypothetical protein GF398_22035 [Chitinivibrionales bacterium]|nr:hypothetical protein [Chitinivibrionales bacterium]